MESNTITLSQMADMIIVISFFSVGFTAFLYLVVDTILDSSELYSGIIGRASINFYAFNSNGNRGIACGLNNIQKLSDGTPLGGHSRAEDDFADLDDDDEDFLS